MAATYFDIEQFPEATLAGFQHTFRVTARDASGVVDAGYAGTVSFTSSDALATLPASTTLTAGTKLFRVRMGTTGPQTVTVGDGSIAAATAHTIVSFTPPGWGLDDKGLLPYGDAASGIGVSIRRALAVSTKEVEVTVSGFVQDNSPYLLGDALNPSTWSVQRLDSAEFLNVVSVTQVGTFTYRLLTLEEFGPVTVTHRASSTTLKDSTGAVIVSPRNADFLGILDEDKVSVLQRLAVKKSAVRDIANPQIPSPEWFAGTLQLTASGDYKLESGVPLIRKLILRRLISTPGDFFHLPAYGIGIRVKEPIPAANLSKLKTAIEQQVLQEPEVARVKATLTLSSSGILTVKVQATLRPTGETLEIGFKSNDTGLVL